MEREIQLDENFSIMYERNENVSSIKNVTDSLNKLEFERYWYQGYAFRGKQLIMRLRQEMAWFCDLDCPYASNHLPGNAVKFTCIQPQKWTPELLELKREIEHKYDQKFNSLLIEKFNCNDKCNSQPFASSVFCKQKESWVESNTKLCVITIGNTAPEKCSWMSKSLTEVTDKKDTTKVSKKLKYMPKSKMKFRNRVYAFSVKHTKEWKIQIPFKRSDAADCFYILSFRCLDPTKTLLHLQNYYPLQPLLTDEQLRECIVRKILLTKEEKDYYSGMAKVYKYTRRKKGSNDVDTINNTNAIDINTIITEIEGNDLCERSNVGEIPTTVAKKRTRQSMGNLSKRKVRKVECVELIDGKKIENTNIVVHQQSTCRGSSCVLDESKTRLGGASSLVQPNNLEVKFVSVDLSEHVVNQEKIVEIDDFN